MKKNTNQTLFKSVVFALLSIAMMSCKSQNTQKYELENGIRNKVKFINETETFSSIQAAMKAHQIPSLSLAIIKQGEIDWAETYQNENFQNLQPIDNSTLFQTASLSKPITFLAALRMHSAGKIDLDANIQGYLKNYVLPKGKQTEDNPVTFRNIFSHTSGIGPVVYLGYDRNAKMPSDLDILKGINGSNTKPIAVIHTPNEILSYSGSGYTLAELALQDTFDATFSEVMQQWILDPAGMTQSTFSQPMPASKESQVAKAYTFSGEEVEGGWKNHPEQAAAGLWSNATELAQFLVEIYKAYQGKDAIFSQSDIKGILNDERDGHVYGFIVDKTNNEISITHYGGNEGYRTGMTINLDTGNGLVYLINSDNGIPLGNALLLSASQVYGWSHFGQLEYTSIQVAPETLKNLVGDYLWNNQTQVPIKYLEKENQIALYFPNGDEYKLTPIKGEAMDFVHANSGVKISFSKSNGFKTFSLYGAEAVKI